MEQILMCGCIWIKKNCIRFSRKIIHRNCGSKIFWCCYWLTVEQWLRLFSGRKYWHSQSSFYRTENWLWIWQRMTSKRSMKGHILESYGHLYSQSLRFWYIGLSFLSVWKQEMYRIIHLFYIWYLVLYHGSFSRMHWMVEPMHWWNTTTWLKK